MKLSDIVVEWAAALAVLAVIANREPVIVQDALNTCTSMPGVSDIARVVLPEAAA